jgi:hypothetical protein
MDEYYEAWQSPKNKRHAEYGGKSRDEIKARSSIAPVPIRPRSRCERRSLRTFADTNVWSTHSSSVSTLDRACGSLSTDFLSRRAFLSAHHPSLSIPTHLDARLSTPPLTPFNSTPTFVALND